MSDTRIAICECPNLFYDGRFKENRGGWQQLTPAMCHIPCFFAKNEIYLGNKTDIDERDQRGNFLKYLIEIDREGCIACATCYTIDSKHFESDAEGKSKVLGGQSNGKSMGSFDDESINEAQAAESSCPVSVIKVTKTE